ncbi:hypothetical protein J113_00610 [Mycobacterium tuberculosis CAS/NITR204]|uniref:Uncharacterized protein n=1 Tax=Mycobacterium tuberculosis CAS/NITR204 TaxID=1310114 RepID=R4M8U9_MYCTX|nr:hypothetical protein J113_00610 [Mycobacterium tuberculosis CAS/NITR204]
MAQCRRTDEGPTLCQHCQPGSARALPTAAWSRQSQRVPATKAVLRARRRGQRSDLRLMRRGVERC